MFHYQLLTDRFQSSKRPLNNIQKSPILRVNYSS